MCPSRRPPSASSALQTAFSVLYLLVRQGDLELGTLVERMSAAPARIAGLAAPTVQAGAPADLCLVDPDGTWLVSNDTLQSRSSNSAWSGNELPAPVKLAVAAGRVAWDDLA